MHFTKRKVVNRFIFSISIFVLTSLSGSTIHAQSNTSMVNDVAQLSKKLGISIAENSKYISLYKETVKWLGTRYRMGGTTLKGVDCSGFTGNIYQAVFDKKLQRRSTDIANNVKESLNKNELQTGDLVFFATSRGKKGINHVGVYLKDNKFAHASCGKGVIVSSLDEAYYQRAWRKGGRVNVEPFSIRFKPASNLSTQIPLLQPSTVKIPSKVESISK